MQKAFLHAETRRTRRISSLRLQAASETDGVRRAKWPDALRVSAPPREQGSGRAMTTQKEATKVHMQLPCRHCWRAFRLATHLSMLCHRIGVVVSLAWGKRPGPID